MMQTGDDLLRGLDLPDRIVRQFSSLPPRAMPNRLIDDGFPMEALQVAGRLMGVQACCRLVHATIVSMSARDLAEADRLLLDLIGDWFDEPDEEARRLALAAAEKLEYATPAALLAGAVGLSAGSLAPKDVEASIQASPDASLALAIGALALAATADHPGIELATAARRFVDQALADLGAL